MENQQKKKSYKAKTLMGGVLLIAIVVFFFWYSMLGGQFILERNWKENVTKTAEINLKKRDRDIFVAECRKRIALVEAKLNFATNQYLISIENIIAQNENAKKSYEEQKSTVVEQFKAIYQTEQAEAETEEDKNFVEQSQKLAQNTGVINVLQTKAQDIKAFDNTLRIKIADKLESASGELKKNYVSVDYQVGEIINWIESDQSKVFSTIENLDVKFDYLAGTSCLGVDSNGTVIRTTADLRKKYQPPVSNQAKDIVNNGAGVGSIFK